MKILRLIRDHFWVTLAGKAEPRQGINNPEGGGEDLLGC